MKNRLRIAMSTNAFPEIELSQRFREAALFGVRYILLAVDKETSIEDAKSAFEDFSALGLSCVQTKSLNMPKSYMDESHYKQAMDEIKKLSEIMKIYGGAQIELTAGSFRGKKEEHLEAAVKFIAQACDIAAESSQFCALDFTPKKNQLIKTWQDMCELYEKVGKDNLLINVNTALMHHFKVSDSDLEFLEGRSAILEIQDIDGDGWDVDVNIGEGISDISTWVDKCAPYVFSSCQKNGGYPAALLLMPDTSEKEVERTLRYLEYIVPKVRL